MKNIKKVLVKVMAVALLFGSVMNVPMTKVQAAVKNVYLSALQDEVIAGTASGADIPDGKYGLDGAFTITDGCNKSMASAASIEIDAKSNQSISFTVEKYANVVIRVSSTGDDASSVMVLCNEKNGAVAPADSKDAAVKVSGTVAQSIVYTNLVAGTYYIKNSGETSSVRIYDVAVIKADSLDDLAEVYIMDPSEDSALSRLDPNDKIEVGKYGTSGFFSFADEATFKDSYINKRANSTQFAIELAKKNGSSISFTAKEGSSFIMFVSSTGSTNVSDICLADAEDSDSKTNKINPSNFSNAIISPKSQDITIVTYNNLKAGSYKISCPADGDNTGRGVRVYFMMVVQPGKAAATPTAIPTPTATPVPTSTPTPTPEVAEPTQTVEPGVTPADTPTPVPTEAGAVTPLPTATPGVATATPVPTDPLVPGMEDISKVPMQDSIFIICLVAGIILVGVAIVVVVIVMDKKARNSNRKSYK